MLSFFHGSTKASHSPTQESNAGQQSKGLLASIRKRVGPILTALFTATAATGAIASEWSQSVNALEEKWIKVVTPGIGPAEFAKTYFQSDDWDLLVDRDWRKVNPSTLVLGREYTLSKRMPTRPEIHAIEKETRKPGGALWLDTARTTYDPVGEVISGTTPEEARRTGTIESASLQARTPVSAPPPKTMPAAKAATPQIKQVVPRDQAKQIPTPQAKQTNSPQTKQAPLPQAKQTPQAKPDVPAKKYGIFSYSFEGMFGPNRGEWMGLNFDVYKEAVAKEESKKKGYYARNDWKGKELWVSMWDWAWGKYQFTTATLHWLWVNLTEQGEVSEKKVQAFLADAALQERLMVRYTKISIDKIRNNQNLAAAVEAGEKSLPVLLAKGHIAGHGNIGKNLHKATDWSKTPVGKYAKLVEGHYFSLVAANDSGKEYASKTPDTSTPTTLATQSQTAASIALIVPPVEKIAQENTPAANDATMSVGELRKISTVVANAKWSVETIASLEQKFSKFWSDTEALTTYIQNHQNEAVRLKKLALTIVGPSREKILKDAITHEKRALALESVLKWPPAGSAGLRKAA